MEPYWVGEVRAEELAGIEETLADVAKSFVGLEEMVAVGSGTYYFQEQEASFLDFLWMVAALEEALEVAADEIPMPQAGVHLGSRNIHMVIWSKLKLGLIPISVYIN